LTICVWGIVIPGAFAQSGGITMEQVITLATSGRESVLAAQQRAEAADHQVGRARAQFLPDLTLTGTYTRRMYETQRMVGGDLVTVQTHNALNANATLGMTIFDARTFPAFRQARLQRDAAKLTAADAKRLAAFDAATSYLDVLNAQKVVSAAERRLELAKETLAQASQRSKAGLAGSNDATRAELEQVSAERDLTRVQGDLKRARLMLEYVVNARLEGALTEPVDLLDAAMRAPTKAGKLSANAQAQRLDLRAARQLTLALDASADEAGLRWVPALTAQAQIRTTNEAGLNGRTWDGFAGLTLTWMLWDGGERGADEASRRAEAIAADFEWRAFEREVDRQVKDALVALRTGQATERQAEAAAKAARQNSRETNQLYRQGLATALAQADANVRLFEAEVEWIRARYDTARALLDVRRALGLDPLGRAVK
jgi:outer membrane protein TolC